MEMLCKHCGRERGDHKAHTFHCPLSRHAFTHFDQEKTYEAGTRKSRRAVKYPNLKI